MFPWQSGSDGREESQQLHLNPRQRPVEPRSPAHRAHHIGIAVAYNVWQFYQVTGDLAYLIDYGAEMLAEIARFWVSRATYDEERDRYSIRGVIGPDEFHAGYPDAPVRRHRQQRLHQRDGGLGDPARPRRAGAAAAAEPARPAWRRSD